MQDAWTAIIAGAYVSLWATMLGTGGLYIYRWVRLRKEMDAATALLFLGIGTSFLGHGEDQTLWMLSNLERALRDGQDLRLSKWYALNIPWFIVAAKYMASFGAFLHLHVALYESRQIPSHRTVTRLSLAWFAVAVGVAVAVF